MLERTVAEKAAIIAASAKRFPCPQCLAKAGETCVRSYVHRTPIDDMHMARWRIYRERSAVERLGEVVDRER